MGQMESPEGKRVFTVTATSEPHENYKTYNIVYGEHLSPGIPILKETAIGGIIEKEIQVNNIDCPNCGGTVRYSHKRKPICQSCSTVVWDDRDWLARDANSAERFANNQ